MGHVAVPNRNCMTKGGGRALVVFGAVFCVLLQTVAALVSTPVSCVGQDRAEPCGRRNSLAHLRRREAFL